MLKQEGNIPTYLDKFVEEQKQGIKGPISKRLEEKLKEHKKIGLPVTSWTVKLILEQMERADEATRENTRYNKWVKIDHIRYLMGNIVEDIEDGRRGFKPQFEDSKEELEKILKNDFSINWQISYDETTCENLIKICGLIYNITPKKIKRRLESNNFNFQITSYEDLIYYNID